MTFMRKCFWKMLPPPAGFLANAVGGDIVLSWEPVPDADGYEIEERAAGGASYRLTKVTEKRRLLLPGRKAGRAYAYRLRAWQVRRGRQIFGRWGEERSVTVPVSGVTTLRNFLQTALAPVGSVMYVWGGGWNAADDGAGGDALRIGLNPEWRRFAKRQGASYDWKQTEYQRGSGLDCSGYVGWCLYNALSVGTEKAGYVCPARRQALMLAERGWGDYRKAGEVSDYRAGDVMSGPGHVYLVIGGCPDGSVSLVHASPVGVQLGGTVTPAGERGSQAVRLAAAYMGRYHGAWDRRYPQTPRGVSYLTDYAQFRWRLTPPGVMSDPEGYRGKGAEEILHDLFSTSGKSGKSGGERAAKKHLHSPGKCTIVGKTRKNRGAFGKAESKVSP